MKQVQPLHLAFITFGFLAIGMLFYAWYNEIFILRIPSRTSVAPIQRGLTTRKNTKLFYYQGGNLKTEEKELLYATQNIIETTHNIVTAWLTLLDEEELWPKKVSLQSVLIDASGTDLSLSFDHSPFLQEQSTHTKLSWLEALLKTIQETGLPLKTIRFLVHNKPLPDPLLDFTHPWPITGYISK